jgi:hypothetical protein
MPGNAQTLTPAPGHCKRVCFFGSRQVSRHVAPNASAQARRANEVSEGTPAPNSHGLSARSRINNAQGVIRPKSFGLIEVIRAIPKAVDASVVIRKYR